MPCVRLDHVDVLDGARQRYIQGIDEELIDFERLVTLVFGAFVIQCLDRQIGLGDALDDIVELAAVIRDEAVEHDVLVFETLGFVDRKQQRRGKVLAGVGLVLVAHYQDGELGGLANLLVQFALGGVLVGYQRNLAGLAADGLDQEVALAVDGAETPLLDLEQLIGDASGLQAVAKVGL